METDPGLAAFHMRYGRRVIDFGRARIVDRERHGVRDRKVISPAFRRLREGIRKAGTLREVLGVERIDMPMPRRRDRLQFEEELKRRHAAFGRGVRKRLPLDAVLIRVNQEPDRISADLRRHGARNELRGDGLLMLFLLTLSLKRLKRPLQDFFRCRLEAAAALAVEVDRRLIELHQEAGLRDICFLVPEILSRQILVAELILRCHLPEEARIEFRGLRLGLLHEGLRRRLLEAEEDLGALHLRALSGRKLHLIGCARRRKYRPGLEGAVVVKKKIGHMCCSRYSV